MKSSFQFILAAIGLALAGCGEPECDGVDCGHDHETTAHVHPTLGPHQGQLIELGDDEFHAELVLDDATETATIYLLDAAALDAVGADAVDAKLNLVHDGAVEQLTLMPNPQLFDAQGESSRFVSTDNKIHHELEHFHGSAQLVIAIGGKQYRGTIGHGHDHGEGHHHHGDDALVWGRPDIQQGDYLISLGHHSKSLPAGAPVEPAVSITRDGQPVPDAEVYNSLWSGDGKSLLAEEVATVYEPPTAEEPAHYAQGELAIPIDADKAVIRFRVVLPQAAAEITYDLPVETDH